MHPSDCRRALEYAVSLSFPRRVGSAGEDLARNCLLRFLEEAGLSPWCEAAPITSRGEGLSRSIPWACAALLWLAWLLSATWPKTAALVALVPLLFSLLRRKVWLELGLRFPPRLQPGVAATTNILAEVRGAEAGEESRAIWLVAHYDTKSYALPASLRLTAAMIIPIAGVTLAAAILGGWAMSAYGWCFGATVAAALVLSARSGNESPGALDNAAAVGILLSLARHYRHRPPRTLVLRWVFTGAEEMGLLGAFAFTRGHREELRRGTHLFVNLDGLGCAGSLRVFGSKTSDLTRAFFEAGRQLGVPLGWGRLPPTMMMDHEVFATAGFSSVSLGCVAWALRHLHSRSDHPGLIHLESLRKTAQLLYHVIDGLDES